MLKMLQFNAESSWHTWKSKKDPKTILSLETKPYDIDIEHNKERS